MQEIEAFDDDTVEELRTRARNSLLTEAIATEEKLNQTDDDLLSLEGMDKAIAASLADNDVRDREALEELAVDELVEFTGISNEQASELIMKARAHWFENEDA